MMQGTSSIVRVASCVVCAGVLAVALMACSGLPATSVEKSVSPAAGKDSTPAAEASADCTGDAEPVTATPGWKIKWSRVFEAPIADPPVVDGSEALIVERADPFVMKLKDTVVSLDLQNGDTRWTFSGANNPGAYSMRQVIDVQASPKYWAIAIRYVMDPHAEEYITVLDRATGQTVYNTDADWLWNIAISDDALYHVDSRLSLRRVDLTTKGVRWEEFWRHSHGSSGLFFVDPWLYEFDVERYVNVQRPISGQLVMTGTLSVTPARWDVLVQDSYAVIRSQWDGVARFDFQSLSTRWTTMVSYLMGRHTNAFWDLPSISATADSIYLFDAENNLMRIDLLTGKVI